MSTKKQIEKSEWQERLDAFSSGNKERLCTIEASGSTLVESIPIVSVNYDPVGKGDDLIITLQGSTHTVFSPSKLFITKQENGVVSELEIVDKHRKSTIIRFV